MRGVSSIAVSSAPVEEPTPAGEPPKAVASEPVGPRRRDAAKSRERLLAAAGELFAERGYEHATIREIGQRAGVDPTLITRYFGGKAALYLAALRGANGSASTDPVDVTDAGRIRLILDRAQINGSMPTLHGAVRPHADPELQAASMAILRQRILTPAARIADDAGLDSSELRAEIVVAALAGIVLSRTSGALETLTSAPADEVAELTAQLLGALLSE